MDAQKGEFKKLSMELGVRRDGFLLGILSFRHFLNRKKRKVVRVVEEMNR